MIIYLDGDVEDDMLNRLIEAYNNIKIAAIPNDNLVIYLSSCGGSTAIGSAIVHLINLNNDITSIVAVEGIQSAALDIFLKSDCKKEVLDGAWGMVHLAYSTIRIIEGGSPKADMDIFWNKEMKLSKTKTIKQLKSFPFNADELAQISEGKDVYLSNKRLRELVNI